MLIIIKKNRVFTSINPNIFSYIYPNESPLAVKRSLLFFVNFAPFKPVAGYLIMFIRVK